MDEIRELQGRLGELSDEEFADLAEKVRAHASEIKDDDESDEATQSLTELGEITDQIVAEKSARETKAAESAEARKVARERINAISGEEETPEEPAEEPEEEDAPEDEPEGEPEAEEAPADAEGADAPVPVVAGGVQAMARKARKPKASPEQGPLRIGASLVASRYFGGEPIVDRKDLGQKIGEAANEQIRNNTLDQRTLVASLLTPYPEERRLGENADENTAKMEAACGPMAPKYDPDTGALVATGGICQPTNVDYSVPTWSTAERPIKDGLAAFEATRGGVRFVQPPDIAEWEGAVTVWTEATDASPGAETKNVKALSCGTEESKYVAAVATRIGFGNMQARFAPEQVAANTDVAMAAAARVAEVNLLKLIEESCVKKIEFSTQLGLSRDLLAQVDACIAAYQSIHRIPDSQSYTVILPRWAREMFKIDMLREQAHDNSGSQNVWEISDAEVDGYFKARNVNVIWAIDGQPTKGTEFYNQIMEVPSENGKFHTTTNKLWETAAKIVWYFFAEGQFQFLDAGRLDLGVVRDSTLDATNDFETFVETFEGIAFRGFAKGAWQLNSTVLASGASGITTNGAADNI